RLAGDDRARARGRDLHRRLGWRCLDCRGARAAHSGRAPSAGHRARRRARRRAVGTSAGRAVTDVGLALPLADADRLGADAARYGHRVVAEMTDADALAPRIAMTKPEVVIAAAAAPHLSARLVAACDAHGARLVVVGDSPRERRFAAGLGVVD